MPKPGGTDRFDPTFFIEDTVAFCQEIHRLAILEYRQVRLLAKPQTREGTPALDDCLSVATKADRLRLRLTDERRPSGASYAKKGGFE